VRMLLTYALRIVLVTIRGQKGVSRCENGGPWRPPWGMPAGLSRLRRRPGSARPGLLIFAAIPGGYGFSPVLRKPPKDNQTRPGGAPPQTNPYLQNNSRFRGPEKEGFDRSIDRFNVSFSSSSSSMMGRPETRCAVCRAKSQRCAVCAPGSPPARSTRARPAAASERAPARQRRRSASLRATRR
jgi:hypothetical protein